MRFGATILACDGLRLTKEEAAFFRDVQPFGFIIFARNAETPDQLRALCGDFREAVGRDCLITVDQEGGRVQRLRAPQWREWMPPLEQAMRTGKRAVRAMYIRGRLIAAELRACGIDSNCAPMLDIAGPDTHEFLKNRCYGTDVSDVVDLGRAMSDGLLAGGVVPIMKHIPGHGAASLDSHFELPVVDKTRDDLNAHDFAPFMALRDLPMGMTAHIVFSAYDDRASTVSPRMMDVIRREIGFGGLLMTDDISMQALGGDLATRSRAALAAGCDVVLHCNDTLAERRMVAEAAGEMNDEAQARAEAAIAARNQPDHIDISALEAEFEGLLATG